MSKKFYIAPESEEVMLNMESSILVVSNIEDGDAADMGGSDDSEKDGF